MASYSAGRVAAARDIIDEAGKSTRFMTPPTPGLRLLRDAVLSLSLTQDFVRPLYHWRTSRPDEHHHSALNASGDDDSQFDGGPAPGAALPNVRLGGGGHGLDHLCGAAAGSFSLLLFGTAMPAELRAAVAGWQARGLPLLLLLITPDAAPRGNAPPTGVAALIIDADQRLHAPALDAVLHRALAQA